MGNWLQPARAKDFLIFCSLRNLGRTHHVLLEIEMLKTLNQNLARRGIYIWNMKDALL